MPSPKPDPHADLPSGSTRNLKRSRATSGLTRTVHVVEPKRTLRTPSLRDAQAKIAAAPRAGSDPSDAVRRLVASHGHLIHALAIRLCHNRADAEDLVQEVFLQAFRKWHTFRGDSKPGTWLYVIAVRACRARLRRHGGPERRIPVLTDVLPWRETTVMEIAAATSDEGTESERSEAIDHVQRAIARLPEHLRLPVLLKDVLEMSVADVAAALGLAENTVKTRVHRARLALRKTMTAKSPAVEAPVPIFEKQVCFDLLKAKLAAMDRGGARSGARVPQGELCARCRAVFRELDLVQDACARLASGDLPKSLRETILHAIDARDQALSRSTARPRRGRRPVKTSGKSSTVR